jgi:hypothetical protein
VLVGCGFVGKATLVLPVRVPGGTVDGENWDSDNPPSFRRQKPAESVGLEWCEAVRSRPAGMADGLYIITLARFLVRL